MSWSLFPINKFPDFEQSWQKLNAAHFNTPLLDPEFYGPVIKEFSSGNELLAVHGDTNSPTAMGIFKRKNRFVWQTFQPSIAPLGGWVCDPNLDLTALRKSLIKALPGFNLLTSISQQDPSLSPRPVEGGSIRTLDYIPTARMHISGSFKDYWSSRSKNLRHSMKRQRNRLAREETETRLELKTAPEDVAAAVADYARLESAGWKGQAGTAVEENDRQSRFYTAMLENFCRREKGLILRYWYNDRLVATDFCIHHDGVVIILKTTYDENERTTSPAQLMRQEAFEMFFDEGKIHTVEFYGRMMDWHTKLTDDSRTMYHTNFYRWPGLAALHSFDQNRKLKAVPAKT